MFDVLVNKVIQHDLRDIVIFLCSDMTEESYIKWESFQWLAVLLWAGRFKTFVFSLRTEWWLRKQWKINDNNTKKDQIILNHIKGIAKIFNRGISFNYQAIDELFDDAINPGIERSNRLRNRYLARIMQLECYIAGVLMAYQKKDLINNDEISRHIDSNKYMKSPKNMGFFYLKRNIKKLYNIDSEFWNASSWSRFVEAENYDFLKKKMREGCRKEYPDLIDFM